MTITAGRAIGLDRAAAARFSFLLALPIIAGAGALKAFDLVGSGFQGYGAQFLAGFVAAAASGFLVIWFLLRYLRTHDFLLFMLYRLAVAALVIGLVVTGVRSATI
jgi:undecaprenyl-diphosphatase